MLCIGYGRFPPQSLTDMWLTMLSMIREERENGDAPFIQPVSLFHFMVTIKSNDNDVLSDDELRQHLFDSTNNHPSLPALA